MTVLESLPTVASKRIALHVSPAAERALRRDHPWLYDQAIRKQSHEGQAGDLAVIFDSKRDFLAIGLYDPESPIRVRVLQHRKPTTINQAWFTERLQTASTIRQPLLAQHTNGYRLVHGENDGLPGLIVDCYAGVLVIKLYTAAWLPHLKDIIAGLQTTQTFDHLALRLSRNIEALTAPYGLHDGQILIGDDLIGPVIFQEHGLNFAADVVHGHKTGFFFDQRDNRAQVRTLSTGRRVLDVFAYSGGFSVYAAAGGAKTVTSLDVSVPALQVAEQNMALNLENPQVAAAEHHTLAADAFEGLQQLHAEGATFELVIVDPPSFAKNAEEIERALAAYTRLTQLALNLLEPEGVLVMASCSSRVPAEDFFATVTQAAKAAGRALHEIKRTAHALDHPVGFPEGEYLKCLFASVRR